MCHYISAVIEKEINVDDINRLGEKYAITFEKCDNSFVVDQLKKSEIYLRKNSALCDCGTELGMLGRMNSPEMLRIEKSEMVKLSKKGWSKNKLDRWIADKNKDLEKGRQRYNTLAQGIHTDIQNWMSYLKNLFNHMPINSFGLLLHWYKADVETEKIKINERIRIKITEVTESTLLNINEDILYEIVK